MLPLLLKHSYHTGTSLERHMVLELLSLNNLRDSDCFAVASPELKRAEHQFVFRCWWVTYASGVTTARNG